MAHIRQFEGLPAQQGCGKTSAGNVDLLVELSNVLLVVTTIVN